MKAHERNFKAPFLCVFRSLVISAYIIIQYTVKHWKRLPGEAVLAPSSRVWKTELGKAPKQPALLLAGVWTGDLPDPHVLLHKQSLPTCIPVLGNALPCLSPLPSPPHFSQVQGVPMRFAVKRWAGSSAVFALPAFGSRSGPGRLRDLKLRKSTNLQPRHWVCLLGLLPPPKHGILTDSSLSEAVRAPVFLLLHC